MTITNFSDLGLADPIQRALRARNHITPTPIQSRAIPKLLGGRDMLGIAQTGTGKTGAFALPILHKLSRKHGHDGKNAAKSPRALVLAPTRELAIQIGRTPGLFPSPGAAGEESLLLLFPGNNAAGQRLFALSRDNVQALSGPLRPICQVIQSHKDIKAVGKQVSQPSC